MRVKLQGLTALYNTWTDPSLLHLKSAFRWGQLYRVTDHRNALFELNIFVSILNSEDLRIPNPRR